MPTFRYLALDQTGAQRRGKMMADSREAVVAQLRASGQFPVEVRFDAEEKASEKVGVLWSLRGGVSHQDLTVFSRQLANLVRGGLTLMHCLEALIEHTENPTLVATLEAVREDVRGGGTLWEALQKHPRIFPPLYVNMVKAGEASGELQAVLDWLADYMEKDAARRAQIRAALAYPTLLAIVGSAAVFFLMTFMVPRFAAIFEELEQALPLPTIILMSVSQFLARWWGVILLGVVALIYAYRFYSATPSGRFVTDAIKLRLWVVGRLQMKMAIARLSRTLSTLLRGGVQVLDALEVARDVIGNEVLAQALDEVRQRVREGERIADYLRRTGRFPPLLVHLAAVGEETGSLPEALKTVADTYDVEVDSELKSLISLLEPALILVMGVIVGSIIAAMVLPIFQMNLMAGR